MLRGIPQPHLWALALMLAAAGGGLHCAPSPESAADPATPPTVPAAEATPASPSPSPTPADGNGGAADDLAARLASKDPRKWVKLFQPDRSVGGYNLALYRRRVPVLLDMNGNIAHRWPQVRAVGRARLTPRGELVTITPDNSVRTYDWDGRETMRFEVPIPEDFPHHDLALLANGNYLLLVRAAADGTDYLLEITPTGEVAWEWYMRDHLERHFQEVYTAGEDVTHSNSIHELPANHRFDAGDTRFRPGNILVSARNLNTIFIVDRQSGEVVWLHQQNLDYQHEATMVPLGRPGAGNVLVFNNGYHDLERYRRSAVLEIDPASGDEVWRYDSPLFFSATGGVQQSLPGGNLLITSSQGGRVFEIDRTGETVWQWIPPYLPMRVHRYPYDYTPQLAALGAPTEEPVEPETDLPFVDADLYNFGLNHEVHHRELFGRRRQLLKNVNGCKRLFLPPQATLHAEYGLDPAILEDPEIQSVSAEVRLTVEPDGGDRELLLDDHLTSGEQEIWRWQRLDMGRFAYSWVTLCVEAEQTTLPLAADTRPMVLLENPRVRIGNRGRHREEDAPTLDQQEQELLEQQLRALGYVN